MLKIAYFCLGLLLMGLLSFFINTSPNYQQETVTGTYVFIQDNPSIHLTDTLVFSDGKVRLGTLLGEYAIEAVQQADGYMYLGPNDLQIPLKIVTVDSLYGNTVGMQGWFVKVY